MQNRWDKQETKIKDVDINKFTSMITLKANDLNTLIKKHRLYEFSYIFWILVNFSIMYCKYFLLDYELTFHFILMRTSYFVVLFLKVILNI